jgi:hypothetical protein
MTCSLENIVVYQRLETIPFQISMAELLNKYTYFSENSLYLITTLTGKFIGYNKEGP